MVFQEQAAKEAAAAAARKLYTGTSEEIREAQALAAAAAEAVASKKEVRILFGINTVILENGLMSRCFSEVAKWAGWATVQNGQNLVGADMGLPETCFFLTLLNKQQYVTMSYTV